MELTVAFDARSLSACSADYEEDEVGLTIRGLCPLIQVFDMPSSLRFYRDVLGFAEVQTPGHNDAAGWTWLRHGDAEVMLNTAYDVGERPSLPDPARVAAHADTVFGGWPVIGCEGGRAASPANRECADAKRSQSEHESLDSCRVRRGSLLDHRRRRRRQFTN